MRLQFILSSDTGLFNFNRLAITFASVLMGVNLLMRRSTTSSSFCSCSWYCLRLRTLGSALSTSGLILVELMGNPWMNQLTFCMRSTKKSISMESAPGQIVLVVSVAGMVVTSRKFWIYARAAMPTCTSMGSFVVTPTSYASPPSFLPLSLPPPTPSSSSSSSSSSAVRPVNRFRISEQLESLSCPPHNMNTSCTLSSSPVSITLPRVM